MKLHHIIAIVTMILSAICMLVIGIAYNFWNEACYWVIFVVLVLGHAIPLFFNSKILDRKRARQQRWYESQKSDKNK